MTHERRKSGFPGLGEMTWLAPEGQALLEHLETHDDAYLDVLPIPPEAREAISELLIAWTMTATMQGGETYKDFTRYWFPFNDEEGGDRIDEIFSVRDNEATQFMLSVFGEDSEASALVSLDGTPSMGARSYDDPNDVTYGDLKRVLTVEHYVRTVLLPGIPGPTKL